VTLNGTWGSGNSQVTLRGSRMMVSTKDQVIPGTRTNAPEMDRLTRDGIQPVRFASFHDGLARLGGIGDVRADINKFAKNQGIVTRIPGAALLPYNPTTQTSMTNDLDISGFVALNRRIHSITSTLGVTGLRWLGGLGTLLLGDTSLTDPTLVVRDTFTNIITSCANLVLNSTDYTAFATNGQTDDVKGTASVTGSANPTWVELVTNSNAADVIWAMAYFPNLGPGVNVFIGTNGNVNQVWYALRSATVPATLLPVVETSTKDVEGTLATTTTAETLATSGACQPSYTLGGITITTDGAANITANDGTYLTQTFPAGLAVGDIGPNITALFSSQFSAVPLAAIVTGLTVKIEIKESNAAFNGYLNDVHLEVNGTQVGASIPDPAELDTSDTVKTMGGSTERWNIAELKGEDLTNIAVVFNIVKGANDGNDRDVTIDYVSLTVTWRLPGSAAAIAVNSGATALPAMPNFAHRMVLLEPIVAQATAITVPRRLVYEDFVWDAEGNRPTATKEYPDVGGLVNIHHGTPVAGGYAVTGGPTAGPGETVLILKEDGKVVNTNLPKANGSVRFLCNALFERPGYIVAQMVASDNTDLQYWEFDLFTNQWHTGTVLQSLTATQIAAQPIPYAEATLNLQQNRIYSIFPNSTDIGVRREFIPPDMKADPRLSNTSEVKFASALYLQTMEMYLGYPEASNTISALDYQERAIGSSSSSTGTVKVDVEVGGDATLASPAISNTFTTGLSATVASRGHYPVPSSGSAYQTAIFRITLDQGSGSTTGTPNGVPVLATTVQEWGEVLLQIDIQLEEDGHSEPSVLSTIQALETLKKTRNLQHLKIDEFSGVASFDKIVSYSKWLSERGATASAADSFEPPIARFLSKIGKVTA
jgi:hypothetical protein